MTTNSKPNDPNNICRISLGYPLDQLLDRNCKFSYLEKKSFLNLNDFYKTYKVDHENDCNTDYKYLGSLELPQIDESDGTDIDFKSGTGNIIIKGMPGTAKSTLALQMAVSSVATAYEDAIYFAIYYSLEEKREDLINKSKEFGWDPYCKKLQYISPLNPNDSIRRYSELLEHILKQPEDKEEDKEVKKCKYCKSENNSNCPEHIKEKENIQKVLFPALTPRHITETHQDLFWERYREIEMLLAASLKLYQTTSNEQEKKEEKKTEEQKQKKPFRLSMVVIDSLNVFGQSFLDRNQLHLLFELFKKYHTIGVFIVEETEEYIQHNIEHGTNIIDYLADVVIHLTSAREKEDKYYLRFFEVTKCRYHHQVYGKHPFKIVSNEPEKAGLKTTEPIYAIRIFPSLHYLVFGTDSDQKDINNEGENNGQGNITSDTKIPEDNKSDEIFCEDVLNKLLPVNDRKVPTVLLIEGPRGSYKTQLARDFQMKEFLLRRSNDSIESGGHVVKFSFKDDLPFDAKVKPFRLSKSFIKGSGFESKDLKTKFWGDIQEVTIPGFSSSKCKLVCWKHTASGFYITEVAIKSGYILPEEFIHLLFEIIDGFSGTEQIDIPKPQRVVFDEIGYIGVSYPLLFSSSTGGDLFVTALVHILRNLKISAVFTGGRGLHPKSDEVIQRISTLVNSIITTDFVDVFGDRFTIVKGQGLIVQSLADANLSEYVPGVCRPIFTGDNFSKSFYIDTEMLTGLVGFETGHIYRPGLVLQLVQDNSIQEEYNENVKKLMESTFHPIHQGKKPGIELYPINQLSSFIIHNSLDLLKGKPIEKTVVCTVDEFYKNDDENENIKESLMILDDKANENCICVDNNIFAKPYFKNVLLIAYHNDTDLKCIVNSQEANNPAENYPKLSSWSELVKEYSRKDKKIKCECSPYDSAMFCLMLDTIIKMYPKTKNHNGIIISNQKKLARLTNELKALYQLIKDAPAITKFRENKKDKFAINKNTEIIIGWYTEIRNFLEENPGLQNKFKLAALPGGGFTGDWYLGIMKGSVSKSLGTSVIGQLTELSEQHQRLIKGVGLPVHERFIAEKADLRPWINAQQNLKEILWIHKNANKRSEVKNYKKIHSSLVGLFRYLLFLENESEIKEMIVDRIAKLIEWSTMGTENIT